MLPAEVYSNNLSPPFVTLSEDIEVLPNADMAYGALTPHKRYLIVNPNDDMLLSWCFSATTEQHSSVPVAKRLQLITEAHTDLSSGTPPSLDNNNFLNRAFMSESAVKSHNTNINNNNNNHSNDLTNIAGTPAFITNLMEYFKFSDEKLHGSSFYENHMALSTPTVMSPKDASASAPPPFPTAKKLSEGNKPSDIKMPSVSIFNEKAKITSRHMPSMDLTIPSKPELTTGVDMEDSVFDDDDCLLNNLPTSVDDLQDKEKQIKMERHFSSPLMSHRHTPSCYDAGRLSAASNGSFAYDGTHSAASNHLEEEFDADDLEVAMINESFEEQQRQYKLYCGDKLKSAFYSAPEEVVYPSKVEQELPVVYPLPVPDNDEMLYTNDALYSHWKEDSPTSTYEIIAKPIVNDIFNNIVTCMDEDDDSLSKSALASLHPSIPESMDSLKLYNTSMQSDISSPQPSFISADDSYVDSEKDAMATVLSSANFVLEDMDSPQLIEPVNRYTSPLRMKSPASFHTPPLPDHDTTLPGDESEDEAELILAWKENKGVVGDNIRYYFPRTQTTPQPPPLLDKLEEPPKNIKCLAHVTEIYDPNGEIDTEPALQYFQSRGMKNFYQRDIDIQRAFLVFPTVEDAKIAVENNKTGLQLRLLEEAPQFVKLKALKMYSELRPCSYDTDDEKEKHLKEMSLPWQTTSEPIAGV